MERLNLNIPTEARREIQALARRRGVTESELARTLVLDALEMERRREFCRRVADAQTPELRSRLVQLADELDGPDV